MQDTISFTTSPDETMDGRRQKEIATLKMGLMRYVAKTFTQKVIYGELSANKITEEWKINLGIEYDYSMERYEIGEDIITSNSSSKRMNALIVKSLSDHWSYGGSISIGASSYNNLKMKFEVMPGIEYDLFPYSESTRRQLRILYRAGYNFVNYTDTTIYNKTEEHLWGHSLTTAYEVVQKWGNINVNVGYSNYFHDWTKNELDFGGYVRFRIAKGLSVRLSGSYSIIHDQLGLVKGGVTAEETLLRIKELETEFSYYVSFGFSYTFGSIYNNVVNPRFGSGRRYFYY